jgi:hypothetical protein
VTHVQPLKPELLICTLKKKKANKYMHDVIAHTLTDTRACAWVLDRGRH